MKNYSVRTDLALEEKERFASDNVEVQGVVLEEEYDEENEIRLTRVVIETENGAKIMGKPTGIYLTLESPDLALEVEENSRVLQERICDCIRELIFHKISCEDGKELKILFVGLGNRAVTPDALGPEVLNHLKITVYEPKKKENDRTNRDTTNGDRKEWNKSQDVENCRTGWDGKSQDDERTILTGIVPGVMAQTGMETAQIMRGIVRETKPDLVIAIDALAARSIRRLGTTIQVTDTGIHPGSGVGNHRHGLTRESLGVPVIAIGVPTVVGTAAIVHDTVSVLIQTLLEHAQTREIGGFLDQLDSDEQYRLICELLEPEFGQMYVTPPDIDQTIKAISYTISEAIHIAFFGGE